MRYYQSWIDFDDNEDSANELVDSDLGESLLSDFSGSDSGFDSQEEDGSSDENSDWFGTDITSSLNTTYPRGSKVSLSFLDCCSCFSLSDALLGQTL